MTTNLLRVQFVEENGAINIAIISSNWLIPKKRESFWPPYKKQYQYEQSLKKNETPNIETWTLHKIQKVLFTEKDNDYHKAKKQLEFCEENSDIPSDFDTALKKLNTIDKPRNRKRPNHYCGKCEDSDEQSDSEKELLNHGINKKKCNNKRLLRPPVISSDDELQVNGEPVITVPNIPLVERFASRSNTPIASTSNTPNALVAKNDIAHSSPKNIKLVKSLDELCFVFGKFGW
ncbi:uncharacterized protein LOC112638474 [Camponotus floridanus]|uniref:uncharacterized protein LOC112638474 n=1 Tax=Camponotus floridanus TaxID=104421 RepID=UPI000DC6AE38|nr:uncharacterized protein LOC112638474 [Camponotus floridanus]